MRISRIKELSVNALKIPMSVAIRRYPIILKKSFTRQNRDKNMPNA